MKTKVLLGLAAVFLVIQAFRPMKNLSAAVPFTGKDDITALHPPSPEVSQILATACYDCHSNHTRYPWYAQVQPTGWWLARHINDGKGALNFSEFGSYTAHRQAKKLQAISDEVTEHSMPLKSYTWIHRDAIFSEPQIKMLADWADSLAEKIEPAP